MTGLLDDFALKPNPLFERSDWRESVRSTLDGMGFKDNRIVDMLLDAKGGLAGPLGLGPEHLEAMVQQGSELIAKGKLDDAVNFLAFASLLDPLDMRPYYALGSAMQLKADYKTAAQNYMMAMTIDPHFANTYLRLGECHLAAKEFDNAKQCFTVAKRIAAGKPDAAKVNAHADRMLAVLETKN